MGEGDEQVFEGDLTLYRHDGRTLGGPLWIDREGLHAAGELVVSRASCVGGALEPAFANGGSRALLVEKRAWWRMNVWIVDVPTPEVGGALLRAMGVASDQRRLDVRIDDDDRASALANWGATFLAALMLYIGTGVGLYSPTLALVFFAAMLLLPFVGLFARDALRASDIAVGIDGITCRRRGATRFVPFTAIRSVLHSRGNVLDVTLHDDSVVRLARIVPDPLADLISSRIRQGIAESKKAPVATSDQLSVRAEPASYRVSAAEGPALERALVDAAASIETRTAAALALRARAPKQLRVAVAVTASPETRKILERIEAGAAADDIAELVRKRMG